MALARALAENNSGGYAAALMNTPDFAQLGSDARFEAVFKRATQTTPKVAKPAAKKPRTLRDQAGRALGDIKTTSKGVTLNIAAKGADGFDEWVNSRAETLLQELHGRWYKERTED